MLRSYIALDSLVLQYKYLTRSLSKTLSVFTVNECSNIKNNVTRRRIFTRPKRTVKRFTRYPTSTLDFRQYPVRFKTSATGTMKLDSPEFQSTFTPELKKLAEIFTKHGYELRIAGGAVRDMLMGKKPHDIDFATNATPEQMKAMFNEERVRTFNENGEKHGTVCARINEKENFEITTLRIDVETDGRHAEVQFTADWKLDANRRDLTVNSMFLGLDGTLYDYFNGYEHLKQGVCTFVGTPAERIQEDYLRILRYFRFFGRICQDPNDHKDEVIQAIVDNMLGLKQISGERIWQELSKILVGPFSKDIVLKMISVGLAPHIGLPEKLNLEEFSKICDLPEISPMGKIAALLYTKDEMLQFHTRCKLSAYERDLGMFLINHRYDVCNDPHPLRIYQKLLMHTKLKASQMREYIIELLKYQNKANLIKDFCKWRLPTFPLNGNVVRMHGAPAGKELGIIIRELKEHWADNDFKQDRVELLKDLPIILNKLGIEPVVKSNSPSKTTKTESKQTEPTEHVNS